MKEEENIKEETNEKETSNEKKITNEEEVSNSKEETKKKKTKKKETKKEKYKIKNKLFQSIKTVKYGRIKPRGTIEVDSIDSQIINLEKKVFLSLQKVK
jgi:hypothetical protein